MGNGNETGMECSHAVVKVGMLLNTSLKGGGDRMDGNTSRGLMQICTSNTPLLSFKSLPFNVILLNTQNLKIHSHLLSSFCSILGRQQHFLCAKEAAMRRAGAATRRRPGMPEKSTGWRGVEAAESFINAAGAQV